MGFFKKHKVGITIVVVIVLAFVLYSLFFAGGDDDASLISTTPEEDIGPAGAELLSALFSLRSIKLDASLFDSEDFKSLVDFSQEIPFEPVGRANPFAPIGVDGSDSDIGSQGGGQATST